jgi:xylose isomerase
LLPIFSCRRFLRGANTSAASHVMRFLVNDLECMSDGRELGGDANRAASMGVGWKKLLGTSVISHWSNKLQY